MIDVIDLLQSTYAQLAYGLNGQQFVNETVQDFIEKFEATFNEILEPPVRLQKEDMLTRFFRVTANKPKRRYSDWDIETIFAPGSSTAKNIMQVDEFIRAFKGFSGAGCIISAEPGYIKTHSHVDSVCLSNFLQFMAFMPSEGYSPFIDIHLHNIDRLGVKAAYLGKSDDDIRQWSMLTAWRKSKNEDRQGSSYIIQTLVVPGYPEERFIRDNPEAFFNRKLAVVKNHHLAVAFLNS